MKKYVFKTKYPTFQQQHLQAIAKILGDTDSGLKGSEIAHALESCRIPDDDPVQTKWRRLYNAFARFQNEQQVGNHVINFLNHVMHPANHTGDPERFREWRDALNRVLSLCGLQVGENGKIKKTERASSLDEALARANRLRSQLEQRKVHALALEHCRAEVVADNCFHAVLEAMKSITSRLRSLSELDGDGAQLVQKALGGDVPILRINSFDSESTRGEQRGFVSLLVGMYGMFRNPVAHEARIEWSMSEQDALDMMTTVSLVHRKLDCVVRVKSVPRQGSNYDT